MSNLLNELATTMKEIDKANNSLYELEDKRYDLNAKILSNKEAKKALLETGVVVGTDLLRYHEVSQMFTLSSTPVFAHEINFDEAESASKNPFKVGDTVNHEMYPSKELVVRFVSGGLVVTDDGDIEGPFSRFSFANKE